LKRGQLEDLLATAVWKRQIVGEREREREREREAGGSATFVSLA